MSDFEGRQRLLKVQLEKTVKLLLDAGRRVVLVYPIPEVGVNVPASLAQMMVAQRELTGFTRPFSYYKQRQQFIFGVLDDLGQSTNIIRIYPHTRLCDAMTCLTSANGKPLYWDADHLSLAGADFVAPLLEPAFASMNEERRRGTVAVRESMRSEGRNFLR